MKVKDQIGPALLLDFKSQNVSRLNEWFKRFPESEEILRDLLQNSALKHALLENMWLSSTFLLRYPNLIDKGLQAQTSLKNPHEACSMLIQSHLQKKESSKKEL